MMGPTVVLTTINAPHSKKLNADELAHCLKNHELAKSVPGHMSSFFGDVKPELQLAFASLFNISHAKLAEAARAFANYSGELYPLAA